MTSCWAVMYAVPLGTLKIAAVSVIGRGVVIEDQFFWIVLLVVVVRRNPANLRVHFRCGPTSTRNYKPLLRGSPPEGRDSRVLKKAVIPAAGLGTRLLSVTKEQPKEMLPVFARAMNGDLCLKPIVQLIFEQLYSVGFRDFCFIVGRGKRAIEDHFTPDLSFISKLDSKGLDGATEELRAFYKMIDDSTLVWINQPAPRGFGDAVLKAKGFTGNDRFLVHAGDSYFISKNAEHLRRLVRIAEEFKPEAVFLSKEVEDPKRFGNVEGETMK